MATKKSGQLAYAVSLITQGNWRFYTLTMPSDVLASCCYVSNRFEDPVEGFQRRLDKRRAKDIAAYVDEGLGTIPAAVILSAQKAAEFVVTGRGKTVRFKRIPQAFLVLDGQHRVYGYSLAKTSLRVPVVIYNGLTKEQEVKLFIDINTKQRPVPNELLLDIKRLAAYEDASEKLLGQLFDEFNGNSESVLQGWLSSAEKVKGKISRVTFNTAVKPLLNRFSQNGLDHIFETLNAYLAAVRQNLEAKGIGEAFADPTVFKAFIEIFPRIARIVIDRNGESFGQEEFSDAMGPIFVRARKALFQEPGSSYKALGEKLVKRLDAEVLI